MLFGLKMGGGIIMGGIKSKQRQVVKKVIIFLLIIMMAFQSNLKLFTEECNAADISFLILSKYSSTLDIGDEFYIFAITSNGKKATFKSSNTKVASVNTYGLVTAKKGGTANITAKISGAEAVCKVKVRKTSISLDKTYLSIENGESAKINATTSNGSEVRYKINKKSIALIDEKGNLTGLKPGDAVITVLADGYSKTCRIKVRKPTVSLSKSNISLYRKGTENLAVKVSSGVKPTYKSNKKSVAVVDEYGKITAVKNGTAIITVKVDGVSKTCIVTVKKPVITLNAYNLTLEEGKTNQIIPKVSSGNKPEFSSSNTSIVTVNSSGKLKAVKKGKAYVYVYEDGIKVKCKITVK